MSKLEQLMQELCPNGIEFHMLGELENKGYIKLGRGNVISKDEIRSTPGDYPVYSSSSVGDGEIGRYGKYMFDDERITWSIDGGGKFFYRSNLKYSVTNVGGWIKVLDEKLINTKYLYYSLINSWTTQEYNYTKKAHPSVIKNEYSIPVPPLEVQSEIVRILDKFTLLTAELTAELTARRKQYEYYRNKLYEKYNENIMELEKIGQVTKLAGFEFSKYVKYSDEGNIIALRGLNVKNGRLILSDVKYIDNSDLNKLDRSKLYENDILYTYVGTVGQVGLVDRNDKYYLAPNVARIRITDEKLIPKYIMYFLLTDTFKKEQLEVLSGNSSMKNITMSNIRKFKLPILPMHQQEKIVNILDKFDKLCNCITGLLPAEIDRTQKQYEYYRDLLLNFKEVDGDE